MATEAKNTTSRELSSGPALSSKIPMEQLLNPLRFVPSANVYELRPACLPAVPRPRAGRKRLQKTAEKS